jgi:hypothetical protein
MSSVVLNAGLVSVVSRRVSTRLVLLSWDVCVAMVSPVMSVNEPPPKGPASCVICARAGREGGIPATSSRKPAFGICRRRWQNLPW